jgi:hypothetical protein
MHESTSCSGRSVISILTAVVSKIFKQVNIHKASEPGGLPGRVLRACVDQPASVFTDIFNLSLSKSVIPACFTQTTIVPVPKNIKVTCLNDYCPIAMKSFESLVMVHINTLSPDTMDTHQHSREESTTMPFPP